MLGLSAAQMTSGDLSLANHQYYQERARQMADYGLEYCVSHPVAFGQPLSLSSLSATHRFDTVSVKMFAYGAVDAPVTVPQGFEYWVAEGRACGGPNSAATLASARVGALVRFGLPAGSAGAQIRSLVVTSLGGDSVDYVVRDGVTSQDVLNESVCSSEYDGAPSSDPLPFSPQASVIDLGNVGTFSGNFRVPRGVPQSVVRVTTSSPVPVSQDGGPLNVPTFSPPSGLPRMGALVVADGFDGVLPFGHYGSLELPASARVHLKGTYHFDVLKLADNTPVDAGGALQVDPTASAKVFVGKLSLGQGRLGLNNTHGSAQNFRFTVQAQASTAEPSPILNFFLPNGGGVALVAAGHRISVQADSTSREIRGAFSAKALQVKFPPAATGVVKKPLFVYDISATTARRSTGSSGPVGNDGSIGDGGTGSTTGSSGHGGTQTTGSTNGHGSTESTGPGNVRVGGGRPPGSAGLEPMILSRQAL